MIPGLETVYDHRLTGASDALIFEWARQSAFSAIVSADRDFVRLVERLGPPLRSSESNDAITPRQN
ncbi:MAG: DUF5615 family PIN-like protein [Acidobacteria bacterium]|nr:DUF5615 family PIN-like protein [Acidobacteriota bacterium]